VLEEPASSAKFGSKRGEEQTEEDHTQLQRFPSNPLIYQDL
jgi:hypothetical protein